MKEFVIYLAGASKNVPDEGFTWRKSAENELYRYADILNYKIKVINPNDYFTYKEKRHKTNKQIKEFYMDKVRHSNLILVNLNNTNTSPGTAQELQCASDNLIPIIGFGTENIYLWLSEADCQVVFNEMNEAIEYIVNFYFN